VAANLLGMGGPNPGKVASRAGRAGDSQLRPVVLLASWFSVAVTSLAFGSIGWQSLPERKLVGIRPTVWNHLGEAGLGGAKPRTFASFIRDGPANANVDYNSRRQGVKLGK